MFSGYRGRFAPSPTGPLHIGSLLTALGSYLDAKSHAGTWHIRIEDIDTFRCQQRFVPLILSTLEEYGLYWDEDVTYQSLSANKHQNALNTISHLCYPCYCTRKTLQAHGLPYPGTCDHATSPRLNTAAETRAHALRVRTPHTTLFFDDLNKGRITINLNTQYGDFIVRRKDGLISYQLAVVCDDFEQNITCVVRGYDLLYDTLKQRYLQNILGYPHPSYLHLPIVVDTAGHKLSKQSQAPPLPTSKRPSLLTQLLSAMGQKPPHTLQKATVHDVIQWGIEHWQRQLLPKQSKIIIKLAECEA